MIPEIEGGGGRGDTPGWAQQRSPAIPCRRARRRFIFQPKSTGLIGEFRWHLARRYDKRACRLARPLTPTFTHLPRQHLHDLVVASTSTARMSPASTGGMTTAATRST